MSTNKITSYGGAWRTCPECGKEFHIPDLDDYAFKRFCRKDGMPTTIYFCKWSHMRAYDKRREEAKKAKKYVPKKVPVAQCRCGECKYYPENISMVKQDCTIIEGRYVYQSRRACRRFVPKEEKDVSSGQEAASGRSEGKT